MIYLLYETHFKQFLSIILLQSCLLNIHVYQYPILFVFSNSYSTIHSLSEESPLTLSSLDSPEISLTESITGG